MVDSDRGAFSPENRLFVDVLHVALARLFTGEDALAPDVFVVNLSIGVPEMRFAGRISALARLAPWSATALSPPSTGHNPRIPSDGMMRSGSQAVHRDRQI